MMRQSRKAAPEEIEFWDALVAARSSGDVRIPTAAEVATSEKPASAIAQSREAVNTGSPDETPRIDPGQLTVQTFSSLQWHA